MLSALNMSLEPVRTVLKNDTCEVQVFTDAGDAGGRLYTVVTVFPIALGKALARRIAVEGLFAQCDDFIGSFMHKNALNLVFNYHHERRITTGEQIYAANFAARKQMAVSFLSALAGTGLSGDVGSLLITEENVNISGERVYLNYFLDFSKLPGENGERHFYSDAALFAFTLLSWSWAERYDGNVEQYPNDLRLMQKKAASGGFRSFSQIISFIRDLPDAPREQRRGITRIFDAVDAVKRAVTANATRTFMTVVVLVTLVYLAWQVGIRINANIQSQRNSVFVGMETIGEVYLGEKYY